MFGGKPSASSSYAAVPGRGSRASGGANLHGSAPRRQVIEFGKRDIAAVAFLPPLGEPPDHGRHARTARYAREGHQNAVQTVDDVRAGKHLAGRNQQARAANHIVFPGNSVDFVNARTPAHVVHSALFASLLY